MIQIDRNLPPTHELNLKAAQELGLVYSTTLGDWVPKKKRQYGHGSNDTRWGHISDQEAVHAHK